MPELMDVLDLDNPSKHLHFCSNATDMIEVAEDVGYFGKN